jgi:dipeptidyl aminopeptidase/acylaminoacyl peptidase
MIGALPAGRSGPAKIRKGSPLLAQSLRLAVPTLLVASALLVPNTASATGNGRLVFSSERDGNRDVFSTEADGSGLLRLTDHESTEQSPAWSPDGQRIAFTSFRDGRQAIFLMNRDGSDQARLSPEDIGTDDATPSWSPDGRSVAFASTRPFNQSWAIWAIDVDGTNLRRLTTAFSFDPAWSPEGSRIAFVGEGSGIYVMNADGSAARRITSGTLPEAHPEWSPDGTQIVFGRYRDWPASNAHELFVVDVATGAERQLTFWNGYDANPSWSPDGTQIVFQRNDGAFGAPELFTVAAPGGTPRRLTTGLAAAWEPHWGVAILEPPPDDTTPPRISIERPGVDSTYLLGSQVTAFYVCRDDRDGPDALRLCQAVVDGNHVSSGAALPTSSPGPHTFTVTAEDAGGNRTVVSRVYMVMFDFAGFAAPRANFPAHNDVKGGDGVPLRFSLAGYHGMDVIADGAPISAELPCDEMPAVDHGAQVRGKLSYHAVHDRYTYLWQTDRAWAGTCRQLIVVLADGTRRYTNFRFR